MIAIQEWKCFMNDNFVIVGDKNLDSNVKTLFEKLSKEILSDDWSSVTLCSAFLT